MDVGNLIGARGPGRNTLDELNVDHRDEPLGLIQRVTRATHLLRAVWPRRLEQCLIAAGVKILCRGPIVNDRCRRPIYLRLNLLDSARKGKDSLSGWIGSDGVAAIDATHALQARPKAPGGYCASREPRQRIDSG